MRNVPRKERGRNYPIIEVLIAVTILVTVVSLAVPAWTEYRVRSAISECLGHAEVVKAQISAYRSATFDWPERHEMNDVMKAGLTRQCAGFTAYDPDTGSFQVNVNEAEINSSLPTLQPQLTPRLKLNVVVGWKCTRGATNETSFEYLPQECRSFNG